jgi:glycosyltransferase involved in cell wall biosynthesis
MRILHTEASLGWGGQEIRILTEAAGMLARGHGVVLTCPREARIFAEAPRYGVPVQDLAIGKKSLAGVLAMRRYLRREPFDVINTHSSTDSWLVALACATLNRAPPIVRTRHISAAVPDNAATRWLYTRATRHIVTTGEKLRHTLSSRNRYPASCLTSVPTGIDTARFAPGDRDAARAQLGLPGGPSIIGIVATLRSWKGHRFLLDAFAQLDAGDAMLVIVGDGPQRQALEQHVAGLDIAGRVVFAGNQADVLPWLRALDIFALPSYANEGVPQALMQAMCCALPCVTTNVGGIGELAIDGATALVVAAQDARNLGAALARLLADRPLRERLGGAARLHCAAHFGRDTMLDRMETVFRNAARAHA